MRNQRFRLVGDELFDMVADPSQSRDVAAAHPQVVAEMRAAFNAFWKSARPLMVNESVPLSPTRPYWTAYETQRAGGELPSWHPEL